MHRSYGRVKEEIGRYVLGGNEGEVGESGREEMEEKVCGEEDHWETLAEVRESRHRQHSRALPPIPIPIQIQIQIRQYNSKEDLILNSQLSKRRDHT